MVGGRLGQTGSWDRGIRFSPTWIGSVWGLSIYNRYRQAVSSLHGVFPENDYTVLLRPIVHVIVTSEKKVFFFIRLKSKEKFSAISA